MKKKTGIAKSWWPAEALVKEVELEIGGQRIDKHNATWLRIYDELFRKDDDKAAYARMVDFADEEKNVDQPIIKKFYLPLIFFFNRNPGLAIPLIALTVGRKSTQTLASGNCKSETLLGPRGIAQMPSQVLVACC